MVQYELDFDINLPWYSTNWIVFGTTCTYVNTLHIRLTTYAGGLLLFGGWGGWGGLSSHLVALALSDRAGRCVESRERGAVLGGA